MINHLSFFQIQLITSFRIVNPNLSYKNNDSNNNNPNIFNNPNIHFHPIHPIWLLRRWYWYDIDTTKCRLRPQWTPIGKTTLPYHWFTALQKSRKTTMKLYKTDSHTIMRLEAICEYHKSGLTGQESVHCANTMWLSILYWALMKEISLISALECENKFLSMFMLYRLSGNKYNDVVMAQNVLKTSSTKHNVAVVSNPSIFTFIFYRRKKKYIIFICWFFVNIFQISSKKLLINKNYGTFEDIRQIHAQSELTRFWHEKMSPNTRFYPLCF